MVGNNQSKLNETIMNDIQVLQSRAAATEADLKNLKEKQESFIIKYSDIHKITAQQFSLEQKADSPEKINQLRELKKQKDALDLHLSTLARELAEFRIDLAKKHEDTIA